jgi:hypothetical protein
MVVSALAGALLILVSARPALAQGARVDFAAGYQFLTFLNNGGSANIPTGWGASFAVGKSDRIKFVGDVGGHYNNGESLHTFQGGVEVAGRRARVVPFVRILAGLAAFSGGDTVFVVTPEGGVKIMGTDRVGVQITAGFPFMTDWEDSARLFRLFAGVVISK